MTIRILLADDHAIVREGIKFLLEHEPGLAVVAEAQDGQEAIDLATRLQPDVILLDLSMPRLSGLSALPLLQEAAPAARVLILTMHDNEQFLAAALQAGAAGYLLKRAAADDLIDAIRAVAAGRIPVIPSVGGRPAEDFLRRGARGGKERPPVDALTPREQEVLRLIAEGQTNKQIAALLHVSIKTVQTHRAHLLEKLDLHDRTELVKYAIQRGYLPLDPPLGP